MSEEYDQQDNVADDPVLESQLGGFFRTELDGQLGRARQAFERQVASHARTPDATPPRSRRVVRAWTIGLVGAAAAASLAALWVTPVLRRPANPEIAHTQPAGIKAFDPVDVVAIDSGAHWEQVDSVISSVALDRGTVVLEDQTPARIVRELSLERMEWVDQRRGVRMKAVVPRESVQLIGLDTY